MKIHEYQARDLLRSFGIPVPGGRVISSPAEANEAFAAATDGMSKPLAVIKAQIHAGGRGKAGFVKLVDNPADALTSATFMLTNRMKSPQTPPEGLEVKKLLVAQAADIASRAGGGSEEFYLAITTDRKSRRNILIASREGGVEIEQVAHDRPDAIIREPLHPILGLQGFAARKRRIQTRLQRQASRTGRGDHASARKAVRREGLHARRDQSADHHACDRRAS